MSDDVRHVNLDSRQIRVLAHPLRSRLLSQLRLNGAALTDGADVDAGDFSTTPAARVRVTLGNLTQASGSQTIEFAVTIN